MPMLSGERKTGTCCVLAVCTLLLGVAAKGDFIFGESTKVPNVNTDLVDGSPQISRDGLELYFNSDRGSIQGECPLDILVARRSTTDEPWSAPVRLDAPVNGPGSEHCPSLSADGLELYFGEGIDCQPNPGGYGNGDLWVSMRQSTDEPWGIPQNLGPLVNSQHHDDTPCISADGLELYFMRNIPDDPRNSEILVSTRPTRDAPWGAPVILGPNVNSDKYEYTPFISPDGLVLFFSRGFSTAHVYVSRRKTKSDPWGPAQFFTPVSSPGQAAEFCLSFSSEDPTLYFTRAAHLFDTGFDIWQVEVTPIIDFDGDGVAALNDLQMLIDHWGTDSTLFDIGPMPLGDGRVDIDDLKVFIEYWEKESAGASDQSHEDDMPLVR